MRESNNWREFIRDHAGREGVVLENKTNKAGILDFGVAKLVTWKCLKNTSRELYNINLNVQTAHIREAIMFDTTWWGANCELLKYLQ